MKGKFYLKKTGEYKRVHLQGITWRTRGLTLKVAPNDLDYSRWGLVVSSKTGPSVERNRLKRMLRQILAQADIKPSYDLVIIVHPSASGVDYSGLAGMLDDILRKARIIEDK